MQCLVVEMLMQFVTSGFCGDGYSLGIIGKEQLFKAYTQQTHLNAQYTVPLDINKEFTNKQKRKDLHNLSVMMDFIKKKVEDYKLQSKSRSLCRNLVNTICLCKKTLSKFIKQFHAIHNSIHYNVVFHKVTAFISNYITRYYLKMNFLTPNSWLLEWHF